MSSIPSHCPKCGAPPMRVDGSRPGHYECDTFLTNNGGVIERATCFQRQRNQAVFALEVLSNAATMSELAFHPANVAARGVITRLMGGAK